MVSAARPALPYTGWVGLRVAGSAAMVRSPTHTRVLRSFVATRLRMVTRTRRPIRTAVVMVLGLYHAPPDSESGS
ncbi:hypothetical protein Lfu02_50990 [Longispora fulva]|nr:hypothetical protein Lfu02_50990 [Longispora fulva]